MAMQLDSVLIRVDAPADADRLWGAGATVIDWRGVVPSHDGGEVTWREATVRVPADVALRLGLIAVGEGLTELRNSADAGKPQVTAPTLVTTTRNSAPIVAHKRHRSWWQRHAGRAEG
jgi:hypothetical protein